MAAPEPPVAAAGLLAKYRELLRLRDRPQGRAETEREREQGRRARARLAARFPGALRELDDLPLSELRRREALLDAVARGRLEAPVWVDLLSRYHGWVRALLRAKRWLAGTRRVDAATLERFAASAWPRELDEPSHERVAALLPEIGAPAGGRLNAIALRELARDAGLDEAEVRRQTLPSRRPP